ncbi:hypothetical protein GOP47_0024129 [Adiantum capillus-veneris]|uniref:RING-type domain-containing protein n=1 Tax=Adiantum capillus-veneris TaxID=13818 RepID=A0A9D4U4U5_ADICA|nr:hypothetical protein GOP47_0024129 [Adiantum capillus-veneris]
MANSRVDVDKTGSFRMSDSLACAGMSSRTSLLSKIDSAGHHRLQSSLPRENGMLLKVEHAVEKSSGEQREFVEHPKPKQGSLMKKLSSLISPKKKPPKSNARKQASLSMQDGRDDGKDHLELLFAQAEATLGELLVRAGASFNAKSTLQEDHHPHPHHQHEGSRSNGSLDSASVRLGSSFGSKSAAVVGHVRRKSLSRVWQQLGGSFFCGSGHLNALLGDDVELRGLAPIPVATYFDNNADEDTVADESYWQSLAESILRQRQKTTDVDLYPVDHLDEGNEFSIKDHMVETSQDFSVTTVPSSQHVHIASREVEAECQVSEIILVPVDQDVSEREEDECRWAACGMNECSLEDSRVEVLVPVEFGHGCTRLNTTLDASPNLAHNYQLHIQSRADCEGVSSSSSKKVVELLNHNSRPMASASLSALDQRAEPILALAAASTSSSAVCGSSSNVEARVQPSEDLLLPNETNLESPASASTSGTATSAIDSRAQKQPELAANSARVSLMVLLHEEAAAAVESVDARDVVEEVGQQAHAVVPQEEEGLVGEEPLALFCCVCMVRRKGAALIPCGHTFCRICSKQLFAGRGACPLCNNLIVQLLDIF